MVGAIVPNIPGQTLVTASQLCWIVLQSECPTLIAACITPLLSSPDLQCKGMSMLVYANQVMA